MKFFMQAAFAGLGAALAQTYLAPLVPEAVPAVVTRWGTPVAGAAAGLYLARMF